MSVAEKMQQKLEEHFNPVSLLIIDESAKHAGHAGAPAGGESHFKVEMVSALFEGKMLIARHRMVNEVLKEELAGPVHALTLSLKTPD